jgi:hypothetical protein
MADPQDLTHLREGYVPLKEYVDLRFDSVCCAIDKSEQLLQARMDGLNEFRSAMSDQSARHVTRDEYAVAHRALEADVRRFDAFMNVHQGKASQGSMLIALAIGLAGLLLSIARLVMK